MDAVVAKAGQQVMSGLGTLKVRDGSQELLYLQWVTDQFSRSGGQLAETDLESRKSC